VLTASIIRANALAALVFGVLAPSEQTSSTVQGRLASLSCDQSGLTCSQQCIK
jgi:hypothetical protein